MVISNHLETPLKKLPMQSTFKPFTISHHRRMYQRDGVLTIRDAQPSDTGVYVCTVVARDRNRGDIREEAEVTVTIQVDQRGMNSIIREFVHPS